mmetsp:Transcript_28206/g.76134  ORF Transcript_28206/g.76134 Transcript_28206/m.76134 type:complete len:269 (-) Transcript_28206:1801-2607(-)
MSSGRTSVATVGMKGRMSVKTVPGLLAARVASFCRTAFSRVRKSTILSTLSTSARSSAVTSGANGSVARLAPGSSTGRGSPARPSLCASRCAWSLLRASMLFTSSSITNCLNQVPSGDSMKRSASRVEEFALAPPLMMAVLPLPCPAAAMRLELRARPKGDISRMGVATGCRKDRELTTGCRKGRLKLGTPSSERPQLPSPPGGRASMLSGRPEPELSGIVEEKGTRMGPSARTLPWSPIALVEAVWKSSNADSRSMKRSASNTLVLP